MSKQPIPVKAEDLGRTDVAWHRDRECYAAVAAASAPPGTGKVVVRFLKEGGEAVQT